MEYTVQKSRITDPVPYLEEIWIRSEHQDSSFVFNKYSFIFSFVYDAKKIRMKFFRSDLNPDPGFHEGLVHQ